MGWICPDCSSENAFSHTGCEVCGRIASAAFLLEERNADRREHRQAINNTIALTAMLNRRMQGIRISALSLRLFSFLLIATLLLFQTQTIITLVESPRLISTGIQKYLDERLTRIGHSVQSAWAFSGRDAPERLVSDMKQAQENVLKTQLPKMKSNCYSAGFFFSNGVKIYRYDKYLVIQREKYAQHVNQRMEWILRQAERAIEAIQSINLEEIFHRN